METKVAIFELLKSFTFVRTPDTQVRHWCRLMRLINFLSQVPMETVFGFTTTPKVGIYLKVVNRNGK